MAGTLCLPDRSGREPVAAMLLLGGSGADTRDGDLALPLHIAPKGGAPGTLRRIAHHLAHHGIASLRGDRRGSGSSGGDAARSDYTTDLEDATACFRWLQGRAEVDGARVGVAGHSAGALTTCHVCRDVPDVAAAGLLGALASPIEDMLRWHVARVRAHWDGCTARQQAELIRDVPGDLLRADSVDRLLEAARRGEEVVHLQGHGTTVEVRTSRLRQDLATAYDEEMRHVTCPALVLHGGDDLNVPVEDALTAYRALRRAGSSDVELAVLPGLDHYLIEVAPDPGRRVLERITRQALCRPMSRAALDVVARWAVRTLLRPP